jgi:branched-chain amino acid transport system permease protein
MKLFSINKQNILKIVLIALALILIVLPLFVESSYYLHLLIMIGINALLAMTFIFVFNTGLVNMSIAGFWAIGAYTSALITMKMNYPFWLSLPLSMLVAGFIALCIGFLLIRTAGFGFVILTSVIGMLVPILIGNMPLLNGYQGIVGIPAPNSINIPFLPPIEFSTKASYYYLTLFIVVVGAIILYAFYRASTGKAFMAIGLNPNLAGTLGINVFNYRLLAFVVASAVAGMAGCLFAHYQHTIMPTSFTMFKTLYIQIYAILGGMDFVFLGPIVGAAVMISIPEFLRILKEVELIFSGTVVILLIIFLPDGVISLFGLRPVRKYLTSGLRTFSESVKHVFSSSKVKK